MEDSDNPRPDDPGPAPAAGTKSTRNRRLGLGLAGLALAGLVLVLILIRSGGGDPATETSQPQTSDSATADLASSSAGPPEEVTDGPPLQELPVYEAVKNVEGYTELPHRADDPPAAAAVRFELPDKPGFFWLSLFDKTSRHYLDPNNPDPPYNKKLYSMPLISRSCHVLISDNQTFILRHLTANPPTNREEINAASNELLHLLSMLAAGGVEGLGLFEPVPSDPVPCWDSDTA